MSYDYTGYGRCQYDSPRAAQPFRPYQPVQPRRVTCWDPPASRVEVLRPPSWPDPEPPYVSHHLDPLDHRPRPRYQLVGYRDRSQDAWPRHRSGYAERDGHLSDRGDQETQLGFDCHPTHGTQRHRPTCWDPPVRQQDCGYPTFDRPRRSDTSWDRPHPQEEVRALPVRPISHQPRYTANQPPWDMYGQPVRVTSQTPNQPPRSPTGWDPPEVPSVAEHSRRPPLREIPLTTAVSDYNEKLRIYRLKQAALLARLNAWFEENTDDENITGENIDNHPKMVLSADVPKDIHVVPNGITYVAINTTVGVDVSDEVKQSEGSHDELTPMLTKASISHQSFAHDADAHKGNKDSLTPEVHISNENIGIEGIDSCDAKRGRPFELKNIKDKNDLMKENSVNDLHRSKYGDGIMYSNRGGKLITVGVDMSHPIELPKRAVFAPNQQPWSFDPGGVASPKHIFAKIVIVSWFPP